MLVSSLIFDSFGNVVSLIFHLSRGGGTLRNPMLNFYALP